MAVLNNISNFDPSDKADGKGKGTDNSSLLVQIIIHCRSLKRTNSLIN